MPEDNNRDGSFERDMYTLMGEIRAFIHSATQEHSDQWTAIKVLEAELNGQGSDGGIKGRLKAVEVKIYIVGAVAMAAMSAGVGIIVTRLFGG